MVTLHAPSPAGRAWLNGSVIRMLGATLSNEGGNSFTQPIAVLPRVNVAPKVAVVGEARPSQTSSVLVSASFRS